MGSSVTRLRVGYISANFAHHVAASHNQCIFGGHDRSIIEVFAISMGDDDGSPTRKRIMRDSEHFLDIADLPYLAQAQRIKALGLHILIDLDGYTQGTKREIFVQKPAPIQMLLMGYVGTTGDPSFEYTVGDPYVLPAHGAQHLVEKAVIMPNSYFVNDYVTTFSDHLEKIPSMKRSDFKLPEDATIFCNFNRHRKFDPMIFKVWMMILERTPGSVMWFLEFDDAKTRMVDRARELGISEDRFIFAPRYPPENHLAVKSLCDLFMDSPVYNAHTTGTDAMWGGVPVLTLPLDRMASRVSASLVAGLGCAPKDLIAESVEDYIRVAVRVHEDKEYRRKLRECVEDARENSTLFNTQRWIYNWERGLQAAWEIYENSGSLNMFVDLGTVDGNDGFVPE